MSNDKSLWPYAQSPGLFKEPGDVLRYLPMSNDKSPWPYAQSPGLFKAPGDVLRYLRAVADAIEGVKLPEDGK